MKVCCEYTEDLHKEIMETMWLGAELLYLNSHTQLFKGRLVYADKGYG
jgi:hypothetical protein